MVESPESPLSSVNMDSSSEQEDIRHDPQGQLSMPPSKRRRTGVASWDRQTPLSSILDDHVPTSPASSISSDTSGELPSTESIKELLGATQEDDYSGRGDDQVTVCRWEGCDAGDLGNMDDLVRHIHVDHIGSRQKKYSCEWSDCVRKGHPHASAYALRAHMRSHTREKPFYCALPECDRSFTRSDALAKHMRTVHETEALRPSDPVPKHQNPALSILGGNTPPASKLQRIKLKLSQRPKDEPDSAFDEEDGKIIAATTMTGYDDNDSLEEIDTPGFGPELGFDEHELTLRPHDLYRLLRRQLHWAEKESAALRDEWEQIAPKRKRAWREKETAFDNLLDAEVHLFRAVMEMDGVPSSGPVANIVNGLEKFRRRDMTIPDPGREPQVPHAT